MRKWEIHWKTWWKKEVKKKMEKGSLTLKKADKRRKIGKKKKKITQTTILDGKNDKRKKNFLRLLAFRLLLKKRSR
jgi:hypothetical protein